MTNKTTDTSADRKVRYTLTVYVDRPIDAEGDDMATAEAWYLAPKTRAALEREVIQALRKLDGDCDCECMTAEIISEVAK